MCIQIFSKENKFIIGGKIEKVNVTTLYAIPAFTSLMMYVQYIRYIYYFNIQRLLYVIK
ncbi:MAG: hypothetical protein PG977_000725 [Bartonella clarridgeiae]|nr:MAG: hypothetical protein PG977_000725 [Bartonella clarridgeiae]